LTKLKSNERNDIDFASIMIIIDDKTDTCGTIGQE